MIKKGARQTVSLLARSVLQDLSGEMAGFFESFGCIKASSDSGKTKIILSEPPFVLPGLYVTKALIDFY